MYLDAAGQILAAPLDPMGGSSLWHERPGRLFDDLYNPPLVAYLLAVTMALFGSSEWAVHLVMLGLAGTSVFIAGILTRRLGHGDRPVWLFAASPILAVASSTAAADVPFLLLSLLTWWAALAARPASAGIASAFSVLTKYAGGLNVVTLPLLLRAGRVRAVAVAAVAVGAYVAWTIATYGEPHPRAAARFLFLSPGRIGECVAHFVAGIGLVGLPAVLPLLRWSRTQTWAALAAGAVAAGFLPEVRLAAAVSFAAGTALLWSAVRGTRWGFAGCAFWLYAIHAVVFVYFGAARYWLPALPPLVWLLAGGGELAAGASLRRWGVSIVLGSGLSLAVAWADAGEADRWRRAADSLPAVARGYQTGRWGFAWYARARGYPALPPRQVLAAGDVVAIPEGIHTAGPSPGQRARLRGVAEHLVPAAALRVMGGGAGLYSSAWGVLPLVWRPGTFDRVTLFRATEFLEHAPEGRLTLDVGTLVAEASLFDGWSASEAFTEDGHTRTFAWTLGPEAALVAVLPPGATHVGLVVHPAAEAVGALEVRVGDTARAVVPLSGGWQALEAPLEGTVPGGRTLVVIRPAGFHRPRPWDGERREVAVALDTIVFERRTP